MNEPVYLDYNATAPLRPAARVAMLDALSAVGNASSVHRFGRAARRRVEDAREAVAAAICAPPAQLVFTGGGTEANDLALLGSGAAHWLVSAGEHDSVLNAVPGGTRLPLRPDGRLDLDALRAALASTAAPALVSLQLANNETGVLQPVAEAAEIAHAHGALVHCDAVQALGKIPIDVAALGVDLLGLSAHKLGGPQGVGALWVADSVPLAARQRGGGQERGRRAGTENVAAIAGFGAAVEAAGAGLGGWTQHRDAFEAALLRLAPAAVVFGSDAPRLPNTTCFAVPGLAAETQLMALDLAGVAVSSGSACSSGKVAPSHVLAAMEVAPDLAAGALRVSAGWASEPGDYERFLAAWAPMAARIDVRVPA